MDSIWIDDCGADLAEVGEYCIFLQLFDPLFVLFPARLMKTKLLFFQTSLNPRRLLSLLGQQGLVAQAELLILQVTKNTTLLIVLFRRRLRCYQIYVQCFSFE